MSSIAAWWALPVIATVLAMAWTAWVSRPRGPGDVSETTRQYDQFRQALQKPARPAPAERPSPPADSTAVPPSAKGPPA